MTVLKINDVNPKDMTPEELREIVDSKLRSYYKNHFKNCKNVDMEVCKLAKMYYLDIWNVYILIIFLVYCLGKLKKSKFYENKITEENKEKIKFYFDNFDVSFSLYEEILERLLKVTQKLNIDFDNCNLQIF